MFLKISVLVEEVIVEEAQSRFRIQRGKEGIHNGGGQKAGESLA